VSAAALGVLRWFAGIGPVILALDDPQWMDASSARVLEFAVRRLEDAPVGVLAAVRIGEGPREPIELRGAIGTNA